MRRVDEEKVNVLTRGDLLMAMEMEGAAVTWL
jgi:hypothetical protein